MVEYQLPKLTAWVRFPSPAPGFLRQYRILHADGAEVYCTAELHNDATTEYALIAQQAERIHGKDEVTSSTLVEGSNKKALKTLTRRRFKAFYCSSESRVNLIYSHPILNKITGFGLSIGLYSHYS